MATLDILYEGYVRHVGSVDMVRNTVCLVRDGEVTMIVDPGMLETNTILVDALQVHGLSLQDITHVFITHYHMDHVRNVGLFPQAAILDYKYVYRGEEWADHAGDGYHLTGDIQIIQTPGHTLDDSALLVKTQQGVMAISHVWWFADRTPVEDPMATDQALLNESRKRVEGLADWIVTPHGGLIKVK